MGYGGKTRWQEARDSAMMLTFVLVYAVVVAVALGFLLWWLL